MHGLFVVSSNGGHFSVIKNSGYIQLNLAISNSVDSKFPRAHLQSFTNDYFELPLFRTFFRYPWEFEIAGFDLRTVSRFFQ